MHHLSQNCFSAFCVLRYYSRFWEYSKECFYIHGAYILVESQTNTQFKYYLPHSKLNKNDQG